MNKTFAGAMMTIMALFVFAVALPLGAVTPELAFPAYILIVALAAVWACWLLAGNEPAATNSPMHLPVGCFLLYAFARYFFNSPETSPEYDARIQLFQIGVCGLVYFCCASYFHRPRDRAFVLTVLALLALLESGYGMWQVFTKSQSILIWDQPSVYAGRAGGTFIYPNHLAALLESILALLVARAALVRREGKSTERSVIIKVLTIYAALMTLAGLMLTRSRGGALAAAIGLAAFPLLGSWRSQGRWLRVAMVLLASGAVVFILLGSDTVRDRFFRSVKMDEQRGAVALGDPSMGGRTIMWKGSLQMIRDHPFFGTGGGSWQWVFQRYKKADFALLTRPEHAHNELLNLAADYGLIGFGLMAWILVAFWRHAHSLTISGHPLETQAFAVGAMVAVTTLVVHSTFDFVLHLPATSVVLAAILGLTAGIEDRPAARLRRHLPLRWRTAAAVTVLVVCALGLWSFVPTARAYRGLDLGNRLRGELEYEAALQYFDFATKVDPKSPEPWARLGDVYRTWATWRLGPDKAAERTQLALQAVAAYDRSLSLNSSQSLVLLDRGKMLEAAGKPAEARASFEKAIQVYPANGYAYFVLGTFLRDHGEPARAKEMFQQADRIHATFSSGLNTYELQDQR